MPRLIMTANAQFAPDTLKRMSRKRPAAATKQAAKPSQKKPVRTRQSAKSAKESALARAAAKEMEMRLRREVVEEAQEKQEKADRLYRSTAAAGGQKNGVSKFAAAIKLPKKK